MCKNHARKRKNIFRSRRSIYRVMDKRAPQASQACENFGPIVRRRVFMYAFVVGPKYWTTAQMSA